MLKANCRLIFKFQEVSIDQLSEFQALVFAILLDFNQIFHYTRCILPKRVTS